MVRLGGLLWCLGWANEPGQRKLRDKTKTRLT
jgi:hypothetical protein